MATNDALIGRALAGRYRLQSRRGTGANGVVLDAIDDQLQRPVAVKIMLPEFVSTLALEARFRLEAQVAGSLNHPNLNAVYDWGVEELEGAMVPYLVLEHLSGGSLRDMLDRGRLLTPSQALMVGLDACRGLDYMHKRGVIHRDLKPANLAFGDDRHLRILDVGISRMVAEQTWSEPTAAGLDAARYASPEQARGGSPLGGTLDSATDVYSLCLVLIEAVTGQVPFSSDSTVATLNARLDKLMPVSADFGPLASVLSHAGSVQPSDRYSAAEFGRALVQAAEKLPRPGNLAIVGSSGFGDNTGGMRRPGDPTGPIQRPEPTVAQPVLLPAPRPDPPGNLDEAGAASSPGDPAPRSPETEAIDVLASVPAQLNIVMANADAEGTPHTTPLPPPPSTSARSHQPPPLASPPSSPAPSAFSSVPPAPPVASIPGELAISLATEQRPPSSAPSVAARVAKPSVDSTSNTSASTAATSAPTESAESTPTLATRVLTDGGGEPRPYDQSKDAPSRPRRRGFGWVFAVLLLVVAASLGAFVATRLLDEKSYAVPDLIGQDVDVAKNEIAGNDWSIVVHKERNDDQVLGNVIRTDPPAGVSLKEGSSIIFVVSEGPTLSVLPDVTGQTLAAATATLASVNLDITVSEEVFCESAPIGDELMCPDIPVGSVISWTVPAQPGIPAGTDVMQRTTVAMVVSKGPAPRTLPNLKGLDEPAAIQLMTDLGLVLERAPDIFSNDFEAGEVADQSLPEGTVLQRGETVRYAMSLGRDEVPMPTIDGQTYDQLFAAINAAGLTIGAVDGPTDGSGTLAVTADGQAVVAGQLLPRGTAIDLTYTAPAPSG